MLRIRATLLLLVGLLLTGCLPLELAAPGGEAPAAPAAAEPPRQVAAPFIPTPASFDATARLEPACPPPPADPAPMTAAQLNRMFHRSDLTYWQSADVGASVRLSDGRLLWVYGDTARKSGIEPPMVSNSVLVTSGTCVSQLITDDPGPTVPETENGLSQWPMSVFRLEPTPADGAGVRDVVVVYYSRIQRGPRMWDFLYRGTTAAVFLVGEDGVPRLSRMSGLTPDSVDSTDINWGAAATIHGDHVYVYGTRTTGEAFVYGRELFVARLPVERPTDGAGLQIWDGQDWQPDASRAAPVLGALGGVSQTLSVMHLDGRWLAFSKRGGDLGDMMTLWTADQPTGPWAATDVLSSPHGLDTGNLQYTPLAHPDIPTPSGALLVSVSRNTNDLDRLMAEPQLGRPLFAEVPLL